MSYRNKGVVVSIFVILVCMICALGAILATDSAYAYIDSVYRFETRKQVRLNLESCLNIGEIRISKNPFENGTYEEITIGCEGSILKENLIYYIFATSTINGIMESGVREIL